MKEKERSKQPLRTQQGKEKPTGCKKTVAYSQAEDDPSFSDRVAEDNPLMISLFPALDSGGFEKFE